MGEWSSLIALLKKTWVIPLYIGESTRCVRFKTGKAVFLKISTSETIVMKSNVVDPDLMVNYSEDNFSLSISCAVLVGPVSSQFSLPRQVKHLERRNTC